MTGTGSKKSKKANKKQKLEEMSVDDKVTALASALGAVSKGMDAKVLTSSIKFQRLADGLDIRRSLLNKEAVDKYVTQVIICGGGAGATETGVDGEGR